MSKIKMAKSSPEEMEKMLQFFQTLEDIMNGEFEQSDWGDYDEEQDEAVARHVRLAWTQFLSFSWQRFYWGFSTLLYNAVDQDLSYLDWKPEIKEALERAAVPENTSTHPTEHPFH